MTGSPASSSSASRDTRDFIEYSRAALPQLVEANLQVLVEAEDLRTLMVEIVRRYLSTITQNFQLTRN